tara:strand:+ start:244 stop:462 length:219 start_codon:yes stop_codon:yes gene_type:complete
MLEEQFQNSIRHIEELWSHLYNRLIQQDILLQEKDKLIKELKSLVYSVDYSGFPDYFVGASDDESTSTTSSD